MSSAKDFYVAIIDFQSVTYVIFQYIIMDNN